MVAAKAWKSIVESNWSMPSSDAVGNCGAGRCIHAAGWRADVYYTYPHSLQVVRRDWPNSKEGNCLTLFSGSINSGCSEEVVMLKHDQYSANSAFLSFIALEKSCASMAFATS